MIEDKIVDLPFGVDKGKKFVLKTMPSFDEARFAIFLGSAISRGSRENGEQQSFFSIGEVLAHYRLMNEPVNPEDGSTEEERLEEKYQRILRILGLISESDQNYIFEKLYSLVRFLDGNGKEQAFLRNEHISDPHNHLFLILESLYARAVFYKGVSG